MATAKHVMRDLAPDSPAESVHHRPHESGALLRRNDRYRADGQPARTIILTTMLPEMEAEETDRHG